MSSPYSLLPLSGSLTAQSAADSAAIVHLVRHHVDAMHLGHAELQHAIYAPDAEWNNVFGRRRTGVIANCIPARVKQYPSLTSSKAHNWVDRGKPAEPVVARILANYLHRHDDAEDDWRLQHAATIMGMVAADASEVQVAGYLRSIARELQYPPGEPRGTRIFAVAAWHAAKAALVRDFAERVLRHEIPPNYPTPEPLADWLAARLLTPEELERWAAEAEAGDSEQEKP